MAETVAFLFADMAGSTGLLARVGPGTYADVLTEYRRAIEEEVRAGGGHVVDREGDGLFLVLPTSTAALRAAAEAQRRITETDWPSQADISVRMGIHAGAAHAYDDGYVGLDVNRAARIGALAHGGQVLVSETARLLAVDDLDTDLSLRELGDFELKGLERPERLHQLLAPGMRDDFPPLAPLANASQERLEDARTVAVLPFEVVGSADDATFLAVGLHNDLLAELSKVPELTVISRTSVLPYRGSEKPIPRICRELNVGTVVEGALQSAGRRIRMTVQLIDGIDDAHRWAETYDRELTAEGLFDIQTELARQIAASLRAELSSDQPPDAGLPTEDVEAYRLAAEGRHHFGLKTEGGFRRAIDLFERAIELDPGYAAAWVGLADSLALMEDYSFGHHEALLERAEEAARRALDLDPDSAAAHASLGLIHNTRQDGPASLREFEEAMRLQPSYADAHNWHSWVSLLIGRAEAGLASAARAVELDPLSAEPIVNLSLGHTAMGDPERGAEEARRAKSFSHFTTADLYEGLGLYEGGHLDRAVEVLEPLSSRAAGELTVPWAGHGPDATLALALIGLEREAEARDILRSIDGDRDPFAVGTVLLALGEIDAARAAFEQVGSMDPWPCLVTHHYHSDLWDGGTSAEMRRDLIEKAHHSWRLSSATDPG